MEFSYIEVINLKRKYTRTFVKEKSNEEALLVLKAEMKMIKDKRKSKEINNHDD